MRPHEPYPPATTHAERGTPPGRLARDAELAALLVLCCNQLAILELRNKPMYHPEDAYFYEALLCTLLAQAELPVRLAAEDIAACGNSYRLGVQRDGDSATIILTLRDQQRQPGPRARRLPRGGKRYPRTGPATTKP